MPLSTIRFVAKRMVWDERKNNRLYIEKAKDDKPYAHFIDIYLTISFTHRNNTIKKEKKEHFQRSSRARRRLNLDPVRLLQAAAAAAVVVVAAAAAAADVALVREEEEVPLEGLAFGV